ncbi:MAG: hypothetical protein FWG98_15660, partial [Candidatus Cloacimonetes bacterium]|nr:hypothetical protein [Candidatus Cloacimonadota bacterium]
MTEKGIYSIKPIKLTDIEYLGNLGTDAIQTDYILSKLITQNILYSAYHKPLTISEIAEKLSIEPFIAEEEVNFLAKNGFMEKIAAEKYQTNMYIADIPDETSEIMHALYVKFAENICKNYIPLVFEQLKDYDPKRFYTPNNDFNFLMWAMSMFACNKKIENLEAESKLNQHFVIRADGTENIAYTALVKDFNNSFNKEIYKSYLAVEHEFTAEDLYPIKTWQFNTYYDNR